MFFFDLPCQYNIDLVQSFHHCESLMSQLAGAVHTAGIVTPWRVQVLLVWPLLIVNTSQRVNALFNIDGVWFRRGRSSFLWGLLVFLTTWMKVVLSDHDQRFSCSWYRSTRTTFRIIVPDIRSVWKLRYHICLRDVLSP